ncbi:type II toxin-antitoxin system VapB family antitoxin [Caenispirillum salinarum]|uniref:type II toxin-antitoxin system VapB family antitoxin n=1 Tax=Caenispirillum salinarum TaxID=859058 RepID=UPI00385082B6
MGYTLTSEETIRKARELASHSGRTIDDVIDEALTEKLSRSSDDEKQARKRALAAFFRELETRTPVDIGDYDADLYDENGIWKSLSSTRRLL